MTGKPASTPRVMASPMPFSMLGMNSFGTTPPVMPFSKTKPAPGSLGPHSIQTWPNMPRPPDCFLSLPSALTLPLRRSR